MINEIELKWNDSLKYKHNIIKYLSNNHNNNENKKIAMEMNESNELYNKQWYDVSEKL